MAVLPRRYKYRDALFPRGPMPMRYSTGRLVWNPAGIIAGASVDEGFMKIGRFKERRGVSDGLAVFDDFWQHLLLYFAVAYCYILSYIVVVASTSPVVAVLLVVGCSNVQATKAKSVEQGRVIEKARLVRTHQMRTAVVQLSHGSIISSYGQLGSICATGIDFRCALCRKLKADGGSSGYDGVCTPCGNTRSISFLFFAVWCHVYNNFLCHELL